MTRQHLSLSALALTVLLAVGGCGGGGSSSGGGGGGTIPNLVVTDIASGLDQPMQYKAVPGSPTLAYVLERGGKVRVLVNDVLQSTPVLDISGSVSTDGEGGLLGIAFDPDFASNRQIYLHFTEGGNVNTQVSRYTLNPGLLTGSTGSAVSIINITQPGTTNHKGGSINFGSDGFLYLANGDGGGGDDPNNFAQDPASLLGKMLRIDPNGDDFPTDAANNYAIPSSNPYVGASAARDEIWAFGLRNPFRWTLDQPTGAFLIADVGQGAFEEVNYQPSGASGRNYGWRVREGNSVTGNGGPTFGSTLKAPFFVIPHPSARSITGGFVYRGTQISGLGGRYLVADYVTDKLWAVPLSFTGGEANAVDLGAATQLSLSASLNGVVDISPDSAGRPILTQLNSGTISRLSAP